MEDVQYAAVVHYLDGIGQRDGDSQRKPFRNSHHQDSHTNDEELDKILDVDRSTFWHPRPLLVHKVVNGEIQHQDDDCDG